jgi:hypothetical protein
MAVRVNDSPRALSALSLIAFGATVIVIFAGVWSEWDPLIAALAGSRAALSPLGLGLSRRALMDSATTGESNKNEMKYSYPSTVAIVVDPPEPYR